MKKQYIYNSGLIDKYLNEPEKAWELTTNSAAFASVIKSGSELWYEVDELGGLDFRMRFIKREIIVYEDSIKLTINHEIILRSISGEIIFDKLYGLDSPAQFYNLIYGLSPFNVKALFIRLPHARAIPPYYGPVKTDASNLFLLNHINSANIKLINLVLAEKHPKKFSELMDFIEDRIQKYFIELYSDIKIPILTLSQLYRNGWKIIGVDQMDELINLFWLDDDSDSNGGIYFSNGKFVTCVQNQENVFNLDNCKSKHYI